MSESKHGFERVMKSRLGKASAIGLAATIGAGCLPAATPWRSPEPNSGIPDSGIHVALIGDSELHRAEHGSGLDPKNLIHLMTDQVVAAGFDVSISDQIGAKTVDALNFGGWPSPGPAINVADLGPNDLAINPTTGQSAVPLDQSIANYNTYLTTTNASCDVLVNAPVVPWGGLNTTAPAWNSYLAGIPNERTAVLVDWNLETHQNPQYLLPGDVHASDEGQIAYRAAVIAGIQECVQLISVPNPGQ